MKRVISLIDMDCFYAQVEQRDNPSLWGQPVIVVQHSRQGVEGGILAVSYEARPFGVKRGMSVADAKAKCAHLNICHVPIGEYADKADIQKYRDASAEVFQVLNNFDSSIVVEKASVDEAFLDLTVYVDQKLKESADDLETCLSKLPSSHVANGADEKEDDTRRIQHLTEFLSECDTDEEQKRLMIAAVTVEEIRSQIREKTQFHCSAGVGNNKMIAKLVCARHKPRQQTVVPWHYVQEILKTTPIEDVRGFGGKLGSRIQELLNIKTMGELLIVEHALLVESFPDQHEWLRAVAEGFDDEPVRPRAESSSIAVSKNFPGRNAIVTYNGMRDWLNGLTKELAKRLATDQAQNKRTAENLVYSVLTEEGKPQKTLKIVSYHPDQLFEQVWKAVKPMNRAENEAAWQPKVFNISLSATRFKSGIPAQNRAITDWLSAKNINTTSIGDASDTDSDEMQVVHEEKPVPNPPSPMKATSTEDAAPSTSVAEIITLDDDDEEDNDDNASSSEDQKQGSETKDEWIEVDGKRISAEAFKKLPPIIKKQYEHRLALESARLLKMSQSAKSAKQASRNGRKRQASLQTENQTKKQKGAAAGGRELMSFFKKRT